MLGVCSELGITDTIQNAMVWLSNLIAPWNPCSASMQVSLAHNGINISLGYCEHTEIPHMKAHVKTMIPTIWYEPSFTFKECTDVPKFTRSNWTYQLLWRALCCHCLQHGNWVQSRSGGPRQSTRSHMARRPNWAHWKLVLVRFPHKEPGQMRKLSRPWHVPLSQFLRRSWCDCN